VNAAALSWFELRFRITWVALPSFLFSRILEQALVLVLEQAQPPALAPVLPREPGLDALAPGPLLLEQV
jgi:hypothetical protein